MAKVLLVDDDVSFTQATGELLRLLDHEVETADSVASARTRLTSTRYDMVLLDLMLPDGSGLNLLEDLPKEKHPPHVAIVTGHPAVKSLVKTLYGPNISYLIKPIDLEQLKTLINKSSSGDQAHPNEAGKQYGCLVGESAPMKHLYSMIERVAQTPANVMLLGESGVGKELVARAIHNASPSTGPFVAANCGAFSRELIGSELFGHEKGAFTGAVGRKPGLFEQANGGTLFLDEVTEMPLDMQPNLLRALETSRVVRLGGTQEIPVHCRVISATNRSETQLAEDNCMREDLYFRLAVFPITIPPLRQRKGDIPLLAKHFLLELNQEVGTAFTLSESALERLVAYDWPGNVRELRHTIHRAFIMSDPQKSSELSLPRQIASPFAKDHTDRSGLQVGKTIEETERELITLTLEQLAGDKRKAAQVLGISLKTLYNRLNAYESNSLSSAEG